MYSLIKDLVLPPTSLVLLLLLGLLLVILGRRKTGWSVTALATAMLYFICTPYAASLLNRFVQTVPPLSDEAAKASDAQAIVVLAGGFMSHAPEYGGNAVDAITLQRLRYAAHLQRLTGLPVLTSGGQPQGALTSVAAMMKDALEQDFGVPVMWIEEHSADTFENAQMSATILRTADIRKILLVTHAAHLPRAVAAFTTAGLVVVPAGTAFAAVSHTSAIDFLPRLTGLEESYYAIYEIVGAAWYGLRHGTPDARRPSEGGDGGSSEAE
jgi:uncharacterized SAM-binding protein YcdF (DUF218 family)